MPLEQFVGKKIGVLMGGLSSEREVSLKSGAAILSSLTKQGYTVLPIDVDPDIAQRVKSEKIDVAFIALHGRYGEDGFIQGLLEIMKIPYTGSGVLASALGMNKALSRQIFISHGLPTPPYCSVTRDDAVTFHKKQTLPPFLPTTTGSSSHSEVPYPLVVKPVSEGSSVGVALVKGPSEMDAAFDEAFRFGPTVLVEKYIAGTEVNVGILDQTALGGIEIHSETAFYDYTAKYTKGMSRHIFPARVQPAAYEVMLALGLRAHQALGCSGYSRVDLILGQDGAPVVLEVNTLPGMTETSLLPEMARGVGISFDQLVEKILATASIEK